QHLGRLEQIVENLNHAAGELDGQLKVAQKDPDPRIREVYAQTLGVHVQQILETSTGVRKALAASAQPIVAVGLGELTRKLDVETAMLANWSRTYQQLGQPEYFLGFPAVPDSAKQSPADKQPRPHNYRKGAA
nr:hypothetical protein [Acidobacteriota bacterium]